MNGRLVTMNLSDNRRARAVYRLHESSRALAAAGDTARLVFAVQLLVCIEGQPVDDRTTAAALRDPSVCQAARHLLTLAGV